MVVPELFRMKIISKRQVTVPQRLMDRLNLKIGDELQVEIDDRNEVRLVPVTWVRSDLFTPQIQLLLEQREKELGKAGVAVDMSLEELLRKLKPTHGKAGNVTVQVEEQIQTERTQVRVPVKVQAKSSQ